MHAINRTRITPEFYKLLKKAIREKGKTTDRRVKKFLEYSPKIQGKRVMVQGREVITQPRVEKMLDTISRNTTAGLGIRSLQAYAQERYVGITRSAITNYLASDETMSKIRRKPQGHHGPRRRGPEGATRWAVERWPNTLGADVIKFASSWNAPVKYALMVVHPRSGYSWCVEIEGETLKSKETSKKMSQILTDARKRFGDPSRITVDRGSEFLGDFQALTERRGIRLILVDKENYVEQKNSVFQRYLVFLRKHHSWKKAFALALKKLRHLPNRITGRAPVGVKHHEKNLTRTYRDVSSDEEDDPKTYAVGDLVYYVRRQAKGILHKSYETKGSGRTWEGPKRITKKHGKKYYVDKEWRKATDLTEYVQRDQRYTERKIKAPPKLPKLRRSKRNRKKTKAFWNR